jgi:hypothetical protein
MGGLSKSLEILKRAALASFEKLTKPTVNQGKTAIPRAPNDQERIGLRLDYAGEVIRNGVTEHTFQLQANAGKVPTSVENWKRKNGGTHAVMATIHVKKDGTKDDVAAGLDEGFDTIEGM